MTDRTFYSPSTGGFYSQAIHGAAIPADAVRISRLRHQQLLEGQASGRAIIARDGKPVLATVAKPSLAELRTAATAQVKAEAARRILAIASLAQQSNDNATIAEHALAVAAGATAPPPQDVQAAQLRRARINAVRAASNALEQIVGTMPASNLTAFDATAARFWPDQE